MAQEPAKDFAAIAEDYAFFEAHATKAAADAATSSQFALPRSEVPVIEQPLPCSPHGTPTLIDASRNNA